MHARVLSDTCMASTEMNRSAVVIHLCYPVVGRELGARTETLTDLTALFHDEIMPASNRAGQICASGTRKLDPNRFVCSLVPLAESPAGLSPPLRGAASPLRPSSFSRGFTPNPAAATRPPSAARLPASLRHFFWRAALVRRA